MIVNNEKNGQLIFSDISGVVMTDDMTMQAIINQFEIGYCL